MYKETNEDAVETATRAGLTDALIKALTEDIMRGTVWQQVTDSELDTEYPVFKLEEELPMFGKVTLLIERVDTDCSYEEYELRLMDEGQKRRVLFAQERTLIESGIVNDLGRLYKAAEHSTYRDNDDEDDQDIAIMKELITQAVRTKPKAKLPPAEERKSEGTIKIRDLLMSSDPDLILSRYIEAFVKINGIDFHSEARRQQEALAKATIEILTNSPLHTADIYIYFDDEQNTLRAYQAGTVQSILINGPMRVGLDITSLQLLADARVFLPNGSETDTKNQLMLAVAVLSNIMRRFL